VRVQLLPQPLRAFSQGAIRVVDLLEEAMPECPELQVVAFHVGETILERFLSYREIEFTQSLSTAVLKQLGDEHLTW
jgi:hypothetical protein